MHIQLIKQLRDTPRTLVTSAPLHTVVSCSIVISVKSIISVWCSSANWDLTCLRKIQGRHWYILVSLHNLTHTIKPAPFASIPCIPNGAKLNTMLAFLRPYKPPRAHFAQTVSKLLRSLDLKIFDLAQVCFHIPGPPFQYPVYPIIYAHRSWRSDIDDNYHDSKRVSSVLAHHERAESKLYIRPRL